RWGRCCRDLSGRWPEMTQWACQPGARRPRAAGTAPFSEWMPALSEIDFAHSPGSIVLDGLVNLGVGVHHELLIPDNRFLERFACYQEHVERPGRVDRRADQDSVAIPIEQDHLTISGRFSFGPGQTVTVNYIGKGIVSGRQALHNSSARSNGEMQIGDGRARLDYRARAERLARHYPDRHEPVVGVDSGDPLPGDLLVARLYHLVPRRQVYPQLKAVHQAS